MNAFKKIQEDKRKKVRGGIRDAKKGSGKSKGEIPEVKMSVS